MIRIASYISIAVTTVTLAWGYAQIGFIPFAQWILFFGAIWLLAQGQRWWWFSGLGLILTVIVAAVGMALRLSPGWMLAAGIFALIAWDLSEFRRRTRFESPSAYLRDLERRHLARVTVLAFVGLWISSILMWLRSQLTIEWGLLLLVVLIISLPQLASWRAGRND